jgi:phosphohistidine phosphatase
VTTRRTLILLRHAQADDSRPGGHDIDRTLTAAGERQAQNVGKFLRDQGIEVDAVLCSSAVRARQTLDQLTQAGEPGRVEVSEEYYNAGADTLLDALRGLPADTAVALLVGHAPGVPGLAIELADPESSDPDAMAVLERRFPAAAVARLEFAGAWADLAKAELVGLRIPDGSEQSVG